MRTRKGNLIVQGDGAIDPVQMCRCHTHRKAKDGQILYKRRNFKLINRDLHLTGCPKLSKLVEQSGEFVLCA